MAYCVGTVKTTKNLEAFIETVDDTKFLPSRQSGG